MCEDLVVAAAEEVRIETSKRKFCKPVTLAGAIQYRVANPGCTVIAGGTDLGVV